MKSNYRYIITDRLGARTVQPMGESDFEIEWNRSKEDGKSDYTKEFGGKIIFKGGAFDKLYNLERSIYRCELQEINIEKLCNGIWKEWFSGQISLNKGDWDLDACTVEISFEEEASYECFERNKSENINLIGRVFPKVKVKVYPGESEINKDDCTKLEPNTPPINLRGYYWCHDGDPEEQGWVAYYHSIRVIGPDRSITTGWVRQVTTVSCDTEMPPEWKLIEDNCPVNRKYAKPAILSNCEAVFNDPDNPNTSFYYKRECQVFGDSEQNLEFRNGMRLDDCLKVFVDEFCPGLTIRSDFFQINPFNESNINYVTNAVSKVRNLILFQKSDVKRPFDDASASRADWSFEKLMTTLNYMFNVEWRIEGDEFIIEHISDTGKTVGIDTTEPKYARYMKGKRRYSYKNEDIPGREVWRWKEEVLSGDFRGSPILYTDGCATSSTEKNYSIEDVTTDVELIIANPSEDSSVISDDGFVIMATEPDGNDYFILSEEPISGAKRVNNTLGLAQLHRDYHKHGRPLKFGIMNGQPTEFFSVEPTKVGEVFTIPLCCDVDFDPGQLVRTMLGDGVVEKAKFSFLSNTLELTLLYSADIGLLPNERPTAQNIAERTYVNESKVIDVTEGWSDPDAGSFISSTIITDEPTNGIAEVLLNHKVRYTPNTDFVGNDIFRYVIRDNWGEPSNTAIATITVHPENEPPIANDDFYQTFINDTLIVPAPGVFSNDFHDIGFTLDSFDSTSEKGATVVVSQDGGLNYVPPQDYDGEDSFEYTIIDEKGLTGTATVHITILDENMPIAVDDNYMAQVNKPLPLTDPLNGLLANDYTPGETVPLTATAESKATEKGGQVTINSDGTFNYTPAADFEGKDTFNYEVNNQYGSSIGKATVDVIRPVYVRLIKSNQTREELRTECQGIPVISGEIKRQDYIFQYYADQNGITPLNIDGIEDFKIRVNNRLRNSPSEPWSDNPTTLNAQGGVSWNWRIQYTYYQTNRGCSAELLYHFERDTVLLTAPHYNII